MLKPYIGVTGFTQAEQVKQALDIFPFTDRILMVGVLVKGAREGTTAHSKRFPALEGVADIFTPDPRVLNIVHHLPGSVGGIAESVSNIRGYLGSHVHGFQVNRLVWPEPDALRLYQEIVPRARVILQITGGAFEAVNRSPAHLIERLKSYRGVITGVLLDASEGEGKIMDPAFLLPFVKAIRQSELRDAIGIGVAGGLCSETVGILSAIADIYPNVSIDAEGRLHDAQDMLDNDAVRKYLSATEDLFTQRILRV